LVSSEPPRAACLEGLGHDRIGLLARQAKGFFGRDVRVAAGHRQNRRAVWHRAQETHYVGPILVRHNHVGDDQIELLLLKKGDSCLAAGRLRDRVPGSGEDRFNGPTDQVHVVDKKDSRHNTSPDCNTQDRRNLWELG
jgi:hypothetical protein